MITFAFVQQQHALHIQPCSYLPITLLAEAKDCNAATDWSVPSKAIVYKNRTYYIKFVYLKHGYIARITVTQKNNEIRIEFAIDIVFVDVPQTMPIWRCYCKEYINK